MTGPEEHADSRRGFGPFPPDWGIPAGSTYSAERAVWIREAVIRHMVAEPHRQLAAARLAAMLREVRLARTKPPE